MNHDDFRRVNQALLDSIQGVLGSWFPAGRIDGKEFCIGSRYGEAGQSMRICIKGEKQGVWSDFSGDDEDSGGDLISLYAYVHGLSPGRACRALATEFGIEITQDPKRTHHAILPPPAARPAPASARSVPAQADKGGEEASEADKKNKSQWIPVLPVPADAGPAPKAHPVRGKPDAYWEYRDHRLPGSPLLGVAYRFSKSDGKKVVIPCVFAKHKITGATEWHWIAFPAPRPLYLRQALRPETVAVVVEGEKCVTAGHRLVGDIHDVVSWPGGCKVVDKADWTWLAGRTVILWPDADAEKYNDKHIKKGQIKPEWEQVGMKAMLKLAVILRDLGCTVYIVEIPEPGEQADGWDIADLIEAGATREDVLAWLTQVRPAPGQVQTSALPSPAVLEPAPVVELESTPEPAQEPAPIRKPEKPVVLPVAVHDALRAHVEPLDFDPNAPESAVEQVQARMKALLDSVPTPTPAGAGSSVAKVRAQLFPTQNGGIKSCRENVYRIMQEDRLLVGLVGLDTFSQLQIKLRATPWDSPPGEWTETDDFQLGMYVADRYGMLVANVADIERGVAQAARVHAFNPVQDYLKQCALSWDGQSRVETALSTYWGAEDSEYTRLIASMFFTAMVMRVFMPGSKYDYAPVFEGGQGLYKSTALRILGGEWFSDTAFEFGEKDGYLAIQGVWLQEIAELQGFNKGEVRAIKGFMTSAVDKYREPYARRMKKVPRVTAFAGTTNEGEYLRDKSGNRRWWPIEVGAVIDIEALTRDRDQLFGEALHFWQAGVKWYPTREQEKRLIIPQQDDRRIKDPWEAIISNYLDGVNARGEPIGAGKKYETDALELLLDCIKFEVNKLTENTPQTMRISDIMKSLGWKKLRHTNGNRGYYYVRPDEKQAGAVK